MLDVLRETGKRLLKEIKPGAPSVAETGLPKGAAGDATHPIDQMAEDIIFDVLRKSGEALTAISEESGIVEINGGGGRTVLMDPIDGSRNAVAGLPFYCTSIAVADGAKLKDVETAYVLNLANGDEFCAETGRGAYVNGRKMATQADDILRLVAFDAHVPGRDIPVIMPLVSESRKARCFGSTALALAYLAAGGASVMTVPSLSRSFDFAAGWLLVREAGGIFTNIEGKDLGELKLGLEHISTILAAGNTELHRKALKLLGRDS